MSAIPEPAPEVVDTRALRKAFAAFATGVTVVTVGDPVPHAMTANSFASVSLEPPLVLVCVGRDAVMHHSLDTAATFGVSVLGDHQEAIARHFADRRRPLGSAQFDAVDWRPGRLTGAPLISGAIATFECAAWRRYDGGDHTIFLGEVLSMDRRPDEDALLFYAGGFRRLSVDESEVVT
ncbi:MAG TPA: flavin reductase family protein [Streptosporangiaceae bacterium]|nr:flavin reductase family protein [Streptosporangiaceae bacterium]